MLLVELILPRLNEPDLVLYVSNNYVEHGSKFYEAKIISFGDVTLGTSSWHGGYAGLRFGDIVFMGDIFTDPQDWPPRKSLGIKAYYAKDEESDKELLFDGKLHFVRLNDEDITYSMYSVSNDLTVTDKVYSGTLKDIFTSACNDLGYTLDSTLITNPPDAITYTAYGEKYVLDNLNDIAKTFSHTFYIEDDVLKVMDMYKDNRYSTLDGFEYFSVEYGMDRPIALFHCKANARDNDDEFWWKGYFTYGDTYTLTPFCRDNPTQDQAEFSLIKLKDWAERERMTLVMPIDTTVKINQRIKVFDEEKYDSIVGTIRVRSITWNFNTDEMTLRGDAEVN